MKKIERNEIEVDVVQHLEELKLDNLFGMLVTSPDGTQHELMSKDWNEIIRLAVIGREEEASTALSFGNVVTFQMRCRQWLQETLGDDAALNTQERTFRFLEEALELAQSLDCSPENATRLLEYVFSRPAGQPGQEVGGVLCTLAVLCSSVYLDLNECGEHELMRCAQPAVRDRIIRKHAAPKTGPLPGEG